MLLEKQLLFTLQCVPKISIILPTRNASATLADAVESILEQTCPHWELIAINDGSTDDTPALLNAFASRDPRIQVLHTDGMGIARALSYGLEHASAPFIARMDADDFCHCERLEKQLSFLQQNEHIGVVASRVKFGGDPRAAQGLATYTRWTNTLLSDSKIRLNRFVESPLIHPSVMFRKTLLAEHGGYREGHFPEDYELWLRWMQAGVSFAKLRETLLTWNDHSDRLTRTDDSHYGETAFTQLKATYLATHLNQVLGTRKLLLWGAGRTSRQRWRPLAQAGFAPVAYLDIDPRKCHQHIAGIPVLDAEQALLDYPAPHSYIVGMVGSRGARQLIRERLLTSGRTEGRDFIFAA